MPTILAMPTSEAVPEGPRRKFLEELFVHYREAGRPTLRVIAKWIKDHEEDRALRGTASTETIRRMMKGDVVPRNWPVVEAVLEALCDLGDRSSDEERWQDDDWQSREEPTPWTFKDELRRRWNAALDQQHGEDPDQLPRLPPRPVPTPVTTPKRGGYGGYGAPPTTRGGYGGYGAPPTNDPWGTGPTGTTRKQSDDEPPF